MKKIILFIHIICILTVTSQAQNSMTDESFKIIGRLQKELSALPDDTSRVLILAELCDLYRFSADSSLNYGKQALDLAQKINYPRGEALALLNLGNLYRQTGDFPLAMQILLKALHISEDRREKYLIARCLTSIAIVYSQLNDNPKAIDYCNRAKVMYEEIDDRRWKYLIEANLSRAFRRNGQLDSAQLHINKALPFLGVNNETALESWILMEAGTLQFELGNHPTAFEYLQRCISINVETKDHFYGSFAFNVMADFFKKIKQPDSAIYFAKKGLNEAQQIEFKFGALEASNLLAEQYETRDIDEALYYHKIAKGINNELYGAKIVQGLQKILSEEQERLRLIEEYRIAEQNRLKQYLLLAGLGVLLLIAFILYRNNIRKHRSNEILKSTLSNLKSTQSQLIQSEKMASLGELTAGIAHEIQNPLNFVNNFSELSNELLDEMKVEFNKGNIDEGFAIADDIKQNLGKINHHGKRADSIVKGMLQHSQKGSGQKEPTDINAMAEEYLRLAYHARLNDAVGQGSLAKDITLNATFKTDLDKNIGNVNLVQQDISRVLLNLFNNAFYAVSDKQKNENADFQPTVTLTTKRKDEFIVISISDNGNGIPEQVLEKVFQPFFTTKPTGQGTGLGLSLSYDIIKAHGGTIQIRNTPGAGAEFIITLPINA